MDTLKKMEKENEIHSTEKHETTERDEITTKEIKLIKRGKAARNYGITTEIVKNKGENGIDILKIFTKMGLKN